VQAELKRLVHHAIIQSTAHLENSSLNTCISELMILLNAISKHGPADLSTPSQHEALGVLIRLLAPVAPHISAELWEKFAKDSPYLNSRSSEFPVALSAHGGGVALDVHTQAWPVGDMSKAVAAMTTVVVQVAGRKRASFEVDRASATEESLIELALQDPGVVKHLGPEGASKVIVVGLGKAKVKSLLVSVVPKKKVDNNK
jgi:leucyl-tRNA synthetase